MLQQYALATGFNNVGGLITLSSMTLPVKPIHISGLGRFQRGERVVNLAGVTIGLGSASLVWLVSPMLYEQYEWLNATFCAGNYSSAVTLRTRVENRAYGLYNAILTLPPTRQLSRGLSRYNEVELLFREVVAL